MRLSHISSGKLGLREEVSGIEGQQLVHHISRHVALHNKDDQASEQAQDAGSTPFAQILCPA